MIGREEAEATTEERQGIDQWLRWGSTLLGGFLVLSVLASCAMHIAQKDKFPSPVDLEAGMFLSIGVILIIVFNLPWTKIRLGELEIERAIEEQATDYANEVDRLKKTIKDLEAALSKAGEITPELQGRLDSVSDEAEQEDERLLLEFLEQSPSWGFTASRIRGKNRQPGGFQRLGHLSVPRIRTLAAKLLQEGKIRTRISKNNNVLYQANR